MNAAPDVAYIPPASPACQVGWLTSHITGVRFAATCGSWRCPLCGPKKTRRFARRVASGRWRYMLTLTMRPDAPADSTAVKTINRQWRTLAQWLKRNAGLNGFSWVNELGGKGGRLHKHALISSRRFDYSRARGAVTRAGFGVVCDFKRLKSARANAVAGYVSKYLSKDLGRKDWPRFARRCQTSVPDAPREPGWRFEKLDSFHFETQKQAQRYLRSAEAENDRLEAMFVWERWQLALNLRGKTASDGGVFDAFDST